MEKRCVSRNFRWEKRHAWEIERHNLESDITWIERLNKFRIWKFRAIKRIVILERLTFSTGKKVRKKFDVLTRNVHSRKPSHLLIVETSSHELTWTLLERKFQRSWARIFLILSARNVGDAVSWKASMGRGKLSGITRKNMTVLASIKESPDSSRPVRYLSERIWRVLLCDRSAWSERILGRFHGEVITVFRLASKIRSISRLDENKNVRSQWRA